MNFRLFAPLALFLSLLVCAPVQAVADTTTSRSTLNEVLERVRFYTLDNGLRVLLYRRGVAPVFAGAVIVRVGGSDENIGHTGISHMLEHMAFKGTQTIGTLDYDRERDLLEELETIALRTDGATKLEGADAERWKAIHAELASVWQNEAFTREYQQRGASEMNATTDAEMTKYFVNLPRSEFEFWCRMESQRILQPVMRQFYQERDVVMEERRMRYDNSPEGKLYEQLLGLSFLRHPYRNPVIGYDFDINRLTATMVEDFHKRYYAPSNMVVALVGDVDPEKDIEVIRRYFGEIPGGPQPARPTYVEAAQRGERQFVLNTNASPQLIVSYRKPQYPDPEDPKISVMLKLLAGSSISPLYEELVKRKQLAASVSYEEAPGIAYPNLVLFQMAVKQPHSTDDVLRAFDQVIERFKKSGVSEESLAIAKRQLAVGFLGGLKSNLGLALDMASAELIFNDWRTILRWYDQVMAVTTADVQSAARTYLVPESRVVARIEREEEKS